MPLTRDRESAFAAIGAAALVAFSVVLFARSAAVLPFWFDESLTVRLSHLAPAHLWRALTAGIELNPPLIYVLTKASHALPGAETLTARLPGLLGYVLLVVSLFVFMRRRIGPWYALAAVALLPLCDYTTRYAVEARAYMAVLGVSGLALVCWQSLEDRFSRRGAIGLTLSVATSLLLHVWAVLLPAAILVGEAVACWRTRRIRWRVIGPLAAASPPLLLYPSLIRTSTLIVFGGPVYTPSLDKLSAALRSDVPRLRVLVLVTLVSCALGWWQARRRKLTAPNAGDGFNAAEIAVLIFLLGSPLIPYLYATVAAGAFMTRYALFALPAVVVFIGALLHAVGRGAVLAGRAAAIVSLAAVVVFLPPKVDLSGRRADVLTVVERMDSRLDPSVPLVLANPIDVTAVDEQASDVLRRRFAYVADPGIALTYTQTNSMDLGFVAGEPYLGIRVTRLPYSTLVTRESWVYLVGKWQPLSWLPQRLKDDGWVLREIGGTPQAPVYEAHRHQVNAESFDADQARITASTSSRLRSISSCVMASRFSRSIGSVFDARTLKCQSGYSAEMPSSE